MSVTSRCVLIAAFVAALLTTTGEAQFPNPPISAPAEAWERVFYVVAGQVPSTTETRPAIVVRGFGPGTTSAELHVFLSTVDTVGWPTAQVYAYHHDERFHPFPNPVGTWHRLEPRIVVP